MVDSGKQRLASKTSVALEKIFTGQMLNCNTEKIVCPVCGEEESIRCAWLDPYRKESRLGAYVHFECLSEQRKNELENPSFAREVVCNHCRETESQCNAQDA